jgi:hypothetical protein
MSIQFGGVYRLEHHQTKGPWLHNRRPTRLAEIVAKNAQDVLIKKDPNTAYLVGPGAETYIFQDDRHGKDYQRFQEIVAPLQKEKSSPPRKGLNIYDYSPLVISKQRVFMNVIEELVSHVLNTPLRKMRVSYGVEDRASRYNSAQWGNVNSPRIRSAFPVEQVRKLGGRPILPERA